MTLSLYCPCLLPPSPLTNAASVTAAAFGGVGVSGLTDGLHDSAGEEWAELLKRAGERGEAHAGNGVAATRCQLVAGKGKWFISDCGGVGVESKSRPRFHDNEAENAPDFMRTTSRYSECDCVLHFFAEFVSFNFVSSYVKIH